MIEVYTGTPGSGKSYHVACLMYSQIGRKNIISNFPMNDEIVKKLIASKKNHAEVIYKDNSELTVPYLIQYAREHHRIGIEKQTYLIIDEAQVIFNCRDFGNNDRQMWCNFFAQHRKLGYEVILITQFLRLLDRQIRSLVEVETGHRKLNNYGIGGILIGLVTMSSWFVSVSFWTGGNKLIIGKDFFRFSKNKAKIYDSFRIFEGNGFDEITFDISNKTAAVSEKESSPATFDSNVFIGQLVQALAVHDARNKV